MVIRTADSVFGSSVESHRNQVKRASIERRTGFWATIAALMSEPEMKADASLDARGLVCPEPLMLVRNRVREMRSGEILHVLATDPSTGRDFTNFCRFMGHELLAETEQQSILHFWIRKG